MEKTITAGIKEVKEVKKVSSWKSSSYIILPKWWLRMLELKKGKKPNYVLLHVREDSILIEPIFDEKT